MLWEGAQASDGREELEASPNFLSLGREGLAATSLYHLSHAPLQTFLWHKRGFWSPVPPFLVTGDSGASRGVPVPVAPLLPALPASCRAVERSPPLQSTAHCHLSPSTAILFCLAGRLRVSRAGGSGSFAVEMIEKGACRAREDASITAPGGGCLLWLGLPGHKRRGGLQLPSVVSQGLSKCPERRREMGSSSPN